MVVPERLRPGTVARAWLTPTSRADGRVAGRLVTTAQAVAEIEHQSRDQQRTADEQGVVVEHLDPVLDGQNQEQRQGAEDDQEDHPPVAEPGRLPHRGFLPLDHGNELENQVDDLLPVGDKYGNQRAEVEQDVKEQIALLRVIQIQKMLENREMAGTGNRQKFRHALHDAQEYSIEIRHMVPPVSRYDIT